MVWVRKETCVSTCALMGGWYTQCQSNNYIVRIVVVCSHTSRFLFLSMMDLLRLDVYHVLCGTVRCYRPCDDAI